jgi:hypothetical protein
VETTIAKFVDIVDQTDSIQEIAAEQEFVDRRGEVGKNGLPLKSMATSLCDSAKVQSAQYFCELMSRSMPGARRV